MLMLLLLPRFHHSQSRGTIVGFLLLPRFQQSQFVDKYRMCVFGNRKIADPTLSGEDWCCAVTDMANNVELYIWWVLQFVNFVIICFGKQIVI